MHLDHRWLEQRESEIEAVQRQTCELGETLAVMGATRLRGGTLATSEGTSLVAPLDANDLDAGEAIRMVDIGMKMRRLGAGLPSELLGSLATLPRRDVADFSELSRLRVGVPRVPARDPRAQTA